MQGGPSTSPGILRLLAWMIFTPVRWKDGKFYNPDRRRRGEVDTAAGKMQKIASLFWERPCIHPPFFFAFAEIISGSLTCLILILWETCDKLIHFPNQPFLVQTGFTTASAGSFAHCNQAEFCPACRHLMLQDSAGKSCSLPQSTPSKQRGKNPLWWAGRRFRTDVTSPVAHQAMPVWGEDKAAGEHL